MICTVKLACSITACVCVCVKQWHHHSNTDTLVYHIFSFPSVAEWTLVCVCGTQSRQCWLLFHFVFTTWTYFWKIMLRCVFFALCWHSLFFKDCFYVSDNKDVRIDLCLPRCVAAPVKQQECCVNRVYQCAVLRPLWWRLWGITSLHGRVFDKWKTTFLLLRVKTPWIPDSYF